MQGGAEELSTESRRQTGGDEGPLDGRTLCVQLPATAISTLVPW